ncbi:hypothetical protein MTR67_018552 [Solanum verrucosum]|uniref:SBP-type domain-containing protein n=1 Tax=Solanum verrucosum TaxID=315347 RepID=A0AAF0QJW4_SOLVR|nr:hypothetical protein MTR67_018552 [Solanum verrucosum]
MECNVKWMMFGSKDPKTDSGSFNFSGFDTVGVYDFDDVDPTSDSKPSNFTFHVEKSIVELSTTSPPMDAYDGPFKLGKRTFESNSGESSVELPSFSISPISSPIAPKKTKFSTHNPLIPHCQVDACNLDLSSAKGYHRKHRVCHTHSKCPKVIILGVERRFCQQCSRFHSLSDFDENKRSCRRRLSDHNARRRKSQQETIQFNSTRLSSLFYDNRQSMNLVFNNDPLVHSKPTADSTWETSEVSKFTLTRGLTLKPYKADSINGQSLVGGVKLSGTTEMRTNASNLYSVSNGTTAEVLSQGVKETTFSLNMGVAPELPRALSLLSNENEFISIGHSTHVNQIIIPEQVMHAIPQSLPFESTEHWQAETTSIQSTHSYFGCEWSQWW